MTAQTADELDQRLRTLKEQRREGTLDLTGYYKELLVLAAMLIESLTEEVDKLNEEEVVTQVPLLLVFVEEQIRRYGERE